MRTRLFIFCFIEVKMYNNNIVNLYFSLVVLSCLSVLRCLIRIFKFENHYRGPIRNLNNKYSYFTPDSCIRYI